MTTTWVFASLDEPTLCIDGLPNEILSLIVTRHLPLRWRFMARRVCARWRDLLDDAPAAAPLSVICGSSWTRRYTMRMRDAAIDYSVLGQDWQRGSVVTASALAECVIAPAARCTERPDVLVERCVKEWGVPIRCVPALFVATQDVALVRYAMIISKRLTFEPGGDLAVVRTADFFRAFEEGKATRLAFDAGLVDVAVATGSLEVVRLVVSLIDPAFDWSRVDSLHWVGAALWSERIDAVAFALALWAAATKQSDSRHGVLSTLWLTLGQLPVDRLVRLNSLACAANCRVRRRRWGARNEPVAVAHDPTCYATIDTVADLVGQAAVDELGQCLIGSWQDRGAILCASAAARAGNTQVLAFACKGMRPEDARDMAAVACRCGHVDAVRWCVLTARLITAREAALYAAEPRRWGEQYTRPKNDTTVFVWLFDPRGGAYLPSQDDDIALMIRTSLSDNYVGRAMWIAQRYPDKVSAGDVARIVGSACRCGVESVYATMDDLETIVHMIDAIAAVAPNACVECDMWADLCTTRGRCEGDTVCLLRYAWARTNGVDACIAAGLLGKCVARPSAPSRAWTRWCRVRPVGAGSMYGDADRESAIRAWFAAKGITPRPN
nr:F-box domain containing protein [Pandoravirus aubagnensis]